MGSARKTDFSAALLTMRSTPKPGETPPAEEESEVAHASGNQETTDQVLTSSPVVVVPSEEPAATVQYKQADMGFTDPNEPTHAFTIRLPRSLHTQWSLALKSEPQKVSGAAKIEELIRAYVASRKVSIQEMIRRSGY